MRPTEKHATSSRINEYHSNPISSAKIDVGSTSPLSSIEGSNPTLQSHAIFSSSLKNQDQHNKPSVSQEDKQFVPIHKPLRKIDKVCHTKEETEIHKCTVCSVEFKYKDHLETHMRSQTDRKHSKRKICDNGFVPNKQIKSRMKIHGSENANTDNSSLLAESRGPNVRIRSALKGSTHRKDRGSRKAQESNNVRGPSPPLDEKDTEISTDTLSTPADIKHKEKQNSTSTLISEAEEEQVQTTSTPSDVNIEISSNTLSSAPAPIPRRSNRIRFAVKPTVYYI